VTSDPIACIIARSDCGSAVQACSSPGSGRTWPNFEHLTRLKVDDVDTHTGPRDRRRLGDNLKHQGDQGALYSPECGDLLFGHERRPGREKEGCRLRNSCLHPFH
jgi:hypothetical protein